MIHRKRSHRSSSQAFTLLEVIAAILLTSVLVAAMLPLMGSGLIGNARPTALQVQGAYALRSHMDYWVHRFLTDFPDNLSGLRDEIYAGENIGPDPYTVHRADWIGFNAEGHETVSAEETGLLLVTLAGEQGDTLTFLFSK